MEDLLRGRRAWKGGNNCWRDLHFSRRHPSSCGVGGLRSLVDTSTLLA